MIDAVITRLKAEVSDFSNRIEGAAEFAALMRANALPQVTPAAHILPLGLRGGRGEAGAGAFTQDVEEVVAVLITLRAHSRTGREALPDLAALTKQVIAAIAGWGPDEAIGVFRLSRGQLVSMSAGTILYQLDFAINDQLRILS
ncbi:MAG: hypothetical protein ACK4NW_10035 [Roseinatronobacter sp.]